MYFSPTCSANEGNCHITLFNYDNSDMTCKKAK